MKLFGRKVGMVHWFMFLVLTAAILVVVAVLILEAVGFFPEGFINAYDRLLQILWFFLIFWMVYNLRFVLSFSGGKFSRGLFLISVGGLFLIVTSFQAVLDRFDMSILSSILADATLSLMVKTVTFIGLVLVAWGLHEIADLYRENK